MIITDDGKPYDGKPWPWVKKVQEEKMASYEGGATRTSADGKPDYEGYLSPDVLIAFGQYMLSMQDTVKGHRDSDNWQLGIPRPRYMKSMWRHFIEVWVLHRQQPKSPKLVSALCALMFNVMGYLHEHLRDPEVG